MANEAAIGGGRRGSRWRIFGWSVAVLLLLLPFVVNAPWTRSDFVVAGVLLGSVGLAFELIVRKSSSIAYRSGAAVAVVAAFLTIWVNGAVGMIGSEGNPYNLAFGGVLLVALIGAILARFRPDGMARAMVAAAIVQVALGAVGLTTDVLGAVLSIGFGGLWLVAAALFRNAGRAA